MTSDFQGFESVIGRWARTTVALFAACSLAIIASSAPAAAEENVIPFVDGKMWLETAPVLKRSFIVGIANLLGAEYLYQKSKGFPDDEKSSIRRVYEGAEDVTLDECVRRIDAWYKANPGQRSTAVVEVIWLEMVAPNLPERLRD